jgi:LacI family transcriptional regulator
MRSTALEINGLHGGKRPTIQDVANALGMHKSTVSVALSGKGTLSSDTRERILSVARDMGYVPNPIAQRLAIGYRNPAVCIFSGALDVGLATEKILLIQRELSKESLEVPIYTCSEGTVEGSISQAAQVRQICRQRPRAIICAGHMLEEAVFEELSDYQGSGGSVITYDNEVPLECDQVIFDREYNAYLAAQHLLERGHKKIGLGLSSKIDWLTSSDSYRQAARRKGFERAVVEYNGIAKDEWIFQHSTYEKGGEELAKAFIEMSDRPTGLCIVNDYVALAFMVTVMRAGIKIPDDLSIVGHDNQPITKYCPVPLTSATQPAEAIAKKVVEMLLERLNDNSLPPRKISITSELVERNSVRSLV